MLVHRRGGQPRENGTFFFYLSVFYNRSFLFVYDKAAAEKPVPVI